MEELKNLKDLFDFPRRQELHDHFINRYLQPARGTELAANMAVKLSEIICNTT